MRLRVSFLAFFLGLAACGAGAQAGGGPAVPNALPPHPPDASKFDAALASFVAHDAASDWNEESCADVAHAFEAEAKKGAKFPEASYDAGLAWSRCGRTADARAAFDRALESDPAFAPARVERALIDAESGKLDEAIAAIEKVVLETQFHDVDALVRLATLQIRRHGTVVGPGCTGDMDCAKRNLQRALAQDDASMAAMNQLALYYLASARDRAGPGKKADTQELELAALVCSQAMRRHPRYAAIHNTAGLIQNELGNSNSAVAYFATAAALDPKMFEAELNLALANLSFRGFAQAETALRKAIALRPGDYDAHLALALALRGQISAGTEAEITAVQAELDRCKAIDPARADAYYNEAILTREFKAKAATSPAAVGSDLKRAKALYAEFVAKAGADPKYALAVKRARGDGKVDRGAIGDIEDTLVFMGIP